MHVNVGVHDSGQIHYDTTHCERSMVFVRNERDTVSISIIPADATTVLRIPLA